MKNLHTKEDLDKDSSWISISSLKKAANMSAIIETHQSEFSLPINLSELTECKTLEKFSDSVTEEPLKFLKSPNPVPYSHLLKVIFRLNEEILILSQQLKSSNKQIDSLTKQVTKTEQESSIKLQSLQEKHEKRLKKTKNDLDFLLKDLNMKSISIVAEQLIKKHTEEIENLKETYEKEIESLKFLHENELIAREVQEEKNTFELKQRFFRYLSEVEKKFRFDLSKLKNRYGKEGNVLGRLEESDEDFESFKESSSIKSFRASRVKMSVNDFFECFSCESGGSTRRDSSS